MSEFVKETPFALLIAGIIVVGLYLANYFLDKGCEQYVSRKAGHGIAGMGILLCVFLFSSVWWPLILTVGFTLTLLIARGVAPTTFRGVGGSSRQSAFAEVFLPSAAVIAILVGWLWLNSPWLAVVPILYTCFGDMVTGLVRSRLYHHEVKGNAGSVAMIVVCLLVAYFYSPYWIAVVGAVVATLAERFTPPSHGFWDDNWSITISSLVVMVVLSFASGLLTPH